MVTTAIKVVIRVASTQNSTSITVSVSRVPLRVNGIIVRSTSVMVSPTVAVSSHGRAALSMVTPNGTLAPVSSSVTATLQSAYGWSNG